MSHWDNYYNSTLESLVPMHEPEPLSSQFCPVLNKSVAFTDQDGTVDEIDLIA